MSEILELTHFMPGTGCDEADLSLLLETLEDGVILPGPNEFVEPDTETIDALDMSGWGLGFSPEFLCEKGYMDHMECTTCGKAPGQPIWTYDEPVSFNIRDVQTLYVHGSDAAMTLRIAFPGYTGTFVIL